MRAAQADASPSHRSVREPDRHGHQVRHTACTACATRIHGTSLGRYRPPSYTAVMRLTRADLESFRGRSLPDLIGPNTRLLFVGINPGLRSAAVGAHFGGG